MTKWLRYLFWEATGGARVSERDDFEHRRRTGRWPREVGTKDDDVAPQDALPSVAGAEQILANMAIMTQQRHALEHARLHAARLERLRGHRPRVRWTMRGVDSIQRRRRD